VEHSEEQNVDVFSLSDDKWVEELRELSTISGDKDIYVELSFPGGKLSTIGFRPLVDGQTIGIPLQREAPSGLGNGGINVYLPAAEQCEYRKIVGKTGAVMLTVAYWPWGMPYAEKIELRIATTLDILLFGENVTRIQ
jgi:hypothetical protein